MVGISTKYWQTYPNIGDQNIGQWEIWRFFFKVLFFFFLIIHFKFIFYFKSILSFYLTTFYIYLINAILKHYYHFIYFIHLILNVLF